MRGVRFDELGRDPVGCYVRGETYVHFCADPGLWGVLLWGRPSADHAIELGRSLLLEFRAPAAPHASIIDASRLDGSDTECFRLLERFMTAHEAALRSWVVRLALVRRKNLFGAVVSGIFDVVPRPYPVSVFDDARSGLEWLAASVSFERSVGVLTTQIESLLEEATGTPPTVAALRELLESHLSGMTLPDAARALGLTERTLQRRLSEAKTTFQDELADARVRVAQRRLAEGDSPVTAIALDVGCASSQQLSSLFRKRTGESPTAWRRRHR